jgi:predicted transcriptional regulator
MGQSEVLAVLTEHKDWMTAREIHKDIPVRYNQVVYSLRKLIKFGFAERRFVKSNMHICQYRKI